VHSLSELLERDADALLIAEEAGDVLAQSSSAGTVGNAISTDSLSEQTSDVSDWRRISWLTHENVRGVWVLVGSTRWSMRTTNSRTDSGL
jgi:hypothetical protein